MLLRLVRFVVACDDCQGELGEDYAGGPYSYFTEAEAREALDAEGTWQDLPDGRLRCGACVAAQSTCTRQGHQWSAWRRCLCLGLTGHDPNTGALTDACPGLVRHCHRCGVIDRHHADTPEVTP